MASPAYISSGSDEIKLGPAPQVFALKLTTGRSVNSKFPGGRVMFIAVDERRLFLNDEDANQFEHAMLDTRIQPAEFMRVSRVQHGRGGGFAIRVERIEDELPAAVSTRSLPDAPSRLEAQLEKSVEMARIHGPAAFAAQPKSRGTAPPPRSAAPVQESHHPDNTARPDSPPFLSEYKMAIETLIAARSYAQSQGLAIEIRCEDVRCLAATFIINASGGRA